jgi:hypothetical protein
MFWEGYLKRVVRDAVETGYRSTVLGIEDHLADKRKVEELKKEISQLEIDKAKKTEEFACREREVEHKVGLERKRQEFEISQAKRETEVKVREENLAADKERFKDEMEFQRKHLEGEIGSLRELVTEMLKRLPSAEIYAEVKRRG